VVFTLEALSADGEVERLRALARPAPQAHHALCIPRMFFIITDSVWRSSSVGLN